MEKCLALLFFIASTAHASSVATYCIDKDGFEDTITEFNESPIARGISVRTLDKTEVSLPMVIFVNKEKRSFTIAEKVDNNLYCVIAIGTGFTPLTEDGKIIK